MNIYTIISRARNLGITLTVVGDRIRYMPKSRTPADLVVSLQEHKPEVMEYLSKELEVATPCIIWEGTANEYRALLIVKEAELVLAKAQLTGTATHDWYTNNRIADLEIKIADLRRWLAEAHESEERNP